MRMETFIRKSLGLKAHMVTKVEEREAEGVLVVQIDRLGQSSPPARLAASTTQVG